MSVSADTISSDAISSPSEPGILLVGQTATADLGTLRDLNVDLVSLAAIALVDIPAVQLDPNISVIGVEATSTIGGVAVEDTFAYVSLVNREVLNSPNPSADITIVDREILRNANPHADIAAVDREVLRNANPEAHIPLFQREILRRLTRAIFKGIQTDLAEVWFAPGVFIDFSNPANRAKFHDGAGRPVSLGVDGSNPTGSPPLLYMHLDGGDINPLDFLVDQTGDGTMHLVTPGNTGYGWGLAPTAPSD